MASRSISDILIDDQTTTGRTSVKLPAAPCLTMLYIKITGGTATIDIEVSEDSEEQTFWPIQTVDETEPLQVVRVSIPAAIIAANITAISGATVKIWYRILVLENVPDSIIDTFEEGDLRARRIVIQGDITAPITVTEDDTWKKLAQAEVATTATTIYTVPALTQAVVKTIFVVNRDTVSRPISLWHDGSANVNMILPPTTILAGGFAVFSGEHYMEPGDTLVADTDAASVVTITVSGIEEPVPT